MRVTLFETTIYAPNRNTWKATVEAPDQYVAIQKLNSQYPGVLYGCYGNGVDGGFRCSNLTPKKTYDV